jgi:hypothetical protein
MYVLGIKRRKERTVSQAASLIKYPCRFAYFAGSLSPTVLVKVFDESGLRACVFKGNLVS